MTCERRDDFVHSFHRVFPFVVLLSVPAAGADLTRWLGPNRDAKIAETGLLKSWPEGGPKSVWKIKGLGEGYSSVAAAGNRLYTQGQEGEQQFVLALDASSGKQVWKTPTSKTYRSDQGNGPRTMPQLDGNRLCVLAADGTLVCLEAETGKKIWGFHYGEKFGSAPPRWGFSEHPLIEGDRLGEPAPFR
jgi:hypothetical protein